MAARKLLNTFRAKAICRSLGLLVDTSGSQRNVLDSERTPAASFCNK